MKVSPQKKSETSWIGDYAEDFGLVRDEENGSLTYPVENIFGYELDYEKELGKLILFDSLVHNQIYFLLGNSKNRFLHL